MPGFTGIIRTTPINDDDGLLLNRLTASLRHHDWYVCDSLSLPNGLIAQVGTGIFPYNRFSESHGIYVGLHGEIYPDSSGDNSPLDYIRNLYLKKGKLFASSLNGSFVIFLHDSIKQRTYLVTDHVGSRPVVYYQMKSGAIIFAPEVRSILNLKGEVFRANQMAIGDMLANGNLTGKRTFVKNVNRMGPAEVLELGAQGTQRHRYWEFKLNEDPADQPISLYHQGLAERLQRAFERRLRGFKENNYAILLSGGKDSRGILGCAVRSGYKIQTVTYGFSQEGWSDPPVSAQLSQTFNLPHLYYQCDLDQYVPFEKSSAYLYNGMRGPSLEWSMWPRLRIDHNVKVALMGDAVFGWHHPRSDDDSMLAHIRANAFDRRADYAKLLRPEFLDSVDEASRTSFEQLVKPSDSYRLLQNRRDYLFFYQTQFNNLNPLRYSQISEVELRSPWLDRELLEFMGAVPSEYRSDCQLYLNTLHEMFPDLFRIPLVGGSVQPTPSQRRLWLHRHRAQLEAELLDQRSAIDDLFDPEAIRDMVDYLAQRVESWTTRTQIQGAVRKVNPLLAVAAGKAYAVFDRARTKRRIHTKEEVYPTYPERVLKVLERVVNIRKALRYVSL